MILGYVALTFAALALYLNLIGIRKAREDSFMRGMAYGLELAAAAAREAAGEVVGSEHREAQLRAAREGRQ